MSIVTNQVSENYLRARRFYLMRQTNFKKILWDSSMFDWKVTFGGSLEMELLPTTDLVMYSDIVFESDLELDVFTSYDISIEDLISTEFLANIDVSEVMELLFDNSIQTEGNAKMDRVSCVGLSSNYYNKIQTNHSVRATRVQIIPFEINEEINTVGTLVIPEILFQEDITWNEEIHTIGNANIQNVSIIDETFNEEMRTSFVAEVQTTEQIDVNFVNEILSSYNFNLDNVTITGIALNQRMNTSASATLLPLPTTQIGFNSQMNVVSSLDYSMTRDRYFSELPDVTMSSFFTMTPMEFLEIEI